MVSTPRSLLLIAIFLIAASTMAVHGDSTVAPVGVVVTDNTVSITWGLTLTENFSSLPVFAIRLDPSNSLNISQPINAAIQKLVPSTSLSNLEVSARTSLKDPSTHTWILQENYTFQVSGANHRSGSTVESNLGFLMMNVSDSLRVQGYELNNVGSAYLLGPLEGFRAMQLAQDITSTKYFFDNVPYANLVVPGNGTLTFNLLDFTWVLPLIGWAHQSDPFESASTWSLPSRVVTQYNMTVGLVLREDQYVPVYEAVYNPSVEITTPPRAVARGNTIVFSLPTGSETIMSGIILAAVAVGASSMVAEWRLTRGPGVKKKKR